MGNVSGRDLLSVVEDIQATIGSDVSLPEGYYVEFGGQFESATEATNRLTILSVIDRALACRQQCSGEGLDTGSQSGCPR